MAKNRGNSRVRADLDGNVEDHSRKGGRPSKQQVKSEETPQTNVAAALMAAQAKAAAEEAAKVEEPVVEEPVFDFDDAVLNLLAKIPDAEMAALEASLEAKSYGHEANVESETKAKEADRLTNEWPKVSAALAAAEKVVNDYRDVIRKQYMSRVVNTKPGSLIKTAGDLIEAYRGTDKAKAIQADADAQIELILTIHCAEALKAKAAAEEAVKVNRANFEAARAAASKAEKDANEFFAKSRDILRAAGLQNVGKAA